MYPRTEEKIDADRKGNFYVVTVRTSLNKKNEEVEEVIRVKHLGPATTLLIRSITLPMHTRGLESGEILRTISLVMTRARHRDHMGFAIKASNIVEGQ